MQSENMVKEELGCFLGRQKFGQRDKVDKLRKAINHRENGVAAERGRLESGKVRMEVEIKNRLSHSKGLLGLGVQGVGPKGEKFCWRCLRILA
ncbi:uncharacterized [Tachysurus ichikawai]